MSVFVLGILFAVAAIAALMSLADSALRGQRAYRQLRAAIDAATAARPIRVELSAISESVNQASARTFCITRQRKATPIQRDFRGLLPVAA